MQCERAVFELIQWMIFGFFLCICHGATFTSSVTCNSCLSRLCLPPLLCSVCHTDAVFCVWRPSEDLRQLLKEGYSYRVYSLQASEGRYSVALASSALLENCCSLCLSGILQYIAIAQSVVFSSKPWTRVTSDTEE